MSAIERLKDLFGRSDDATDGLELIRELLAEREAELTLEAEYGRPHPNMTDEPTIVFPFTTFTKDGKEYGAGAKEFRLPDNGLEDDAPLTEFIAKRHGVSVEEVGFEELAAVEGTTAPAELTENGDVEVGA